MKKKVFSDENGFYYEGASITTGGEGGTLNHRPKLGYTIYYNPLTKDKIAILDYDLELAKKSNNEKDIYHDELSYINNGYIKIRPPKKSSSLGCWTWSLEKFNQEKNNILIKQTKNGYSVLKKEYIPLNLIKNNNNEVICKIIKNLPIKSFINDISSAQGTADLSTLFPNKIFGYPKPLVLLKKLIGATETNIIANMDNKSNPDIILDFFSGSATTAHAVMQLNAEDGGRRKFIMVQLPELADEKSDAYKAGYKNICEIGKERIRRAGKKILQEWNDKNNDGNLLDNSDKLPPDLGFKVFKLDTSNLVKWDSTPTDNPNEIIDRMSLLKDTIKPDRTDLDMVYEVMLKTGIPLDSPITDTLIEEKKVYNVKNGDLQILICLDYGKTGITADDIRIMLDTLAPSKIVASEKSFKDDVELSNSYYILKDYGIEMKLL